MSPNPTPGSSTGRDNPSDPTPGSDPSAAKRGLRNVVRWIFTGSIDSFRREVTGGRPFRTVGRGILLASLVGVVAGLGAVLFHLMIGLISAGALQLIAGYDPGAPAGESGFMDELLLEHHAGKFVPWLLVIVPTVGGLISGWLVYTFAPEAEGHGTDAAIEAYHQKRGAIRARVPIVKMVASAITLGTGGSGGREGPIAQIGAGFGSFLATRLGLSAMERRLLMVAGVGAGIAAIFHAPLAGAIFAIEVLYRDPDFEAEALIPSFIACTVAYCVFCLTLGITMGFDAFRPLFDVAPGIEFDNPAMLLPLAVLALAMAAASWGYVRCFYGTTSLFRKLPVPRKLKPALGAMLTGAVALIAFYSLRHYVQLNPAILDHFDPAHESLGMLASGYGFLQKILTLDPATMPGLRWLIIALLVVGLGKILTTSLTIGSGGSGGVFGPSMVIGGSLGCVVGLAFQMAGWIAPSDVVIFTILGMASFFAAAANTPVSTLIMVSELTSSYALLLPSMWVCAVAYLFSRGWSIYLEQVNSRVDSPAHRGDFIIDILEGLKVRNALTDAGRHFITVPRDMPLRDVVRLIADTRQIAFPVVDDDGKYMGVFGINDVRQFLYDSGMAELATAEDLATAADPLTLDTVLSEAIGQFAEVAWEELPVVEQDSADTVVGLMRRGDIIAAYNTRLMTMRTDRQKEAM
jgi:CIC family chloride channel protein